MRYSVFYHHICLAAKEMHCSVEEMLDTIRAWGVTHVEIDRDQAGETEADIRAFSDMLKRHDMQPSNICGFYDWSSVGEMPEKEALLIRQAQLLGCERIMVIPGLYSGEEAARDQEKARMLAGMQRLVSRAQEAGLTVTIECFDNARSPIATIAGMEEFLQAAPGLGVTLETGNFLFSGEDILQAQQCFRGKVRHVHLKDRYLPAREGGAVPEHLRGGTPTTSVVGEVMLPCAVGQGHIPMETVLAGLEADGYEGLMTIEHFGAASYAQAIRDSIDWLLAREARA